MTNSEIVAQLTAEQKVSLLTGNGLWRTASIDAFNIRSFVMTDGTYGVRYSTSQIEDGANWSISDFLSVVDQDAADATAHESQELKGTESYFSKSKPATCFPNGSALACSWDLDLVRRMGAALGRECQHFNVGILLGPGINIRRTPLAGRGYEYYSEDPFLTGFVASALINGIQSEGVGTSLKHFAGNNSEFKRTEMNSIIDKRALMEIYLRGFQIAIEQADPWTVMSSYNRLNGEQTSQSHFLLTEVLRNTFKFNGTVMSDWYGIKDRVASLLAGNDLAMPETKRDRQELLQAVKQGTIDISVVNKSCERMLDLIDKVYAHKKENFTADFKQHHELAVEIAAKSMVLLKNDDRILPLTKRKYKKIAVIGVGAVSPVIQGSGCATTVPYILDRPLDEIFELAAGEFEIKYAVGRADAKITDPKESDHAKARKEAAALAAEADVAVIFSATVIGEDGENGDRHDLLIDPLDDALIDEISKVQSNTVVVVANADSIIMPWLPKVKACIETFFAGQGMGGAVAKVLFGRQNPCGKLTVTVPNSLEETPAFLQYPGDLLDHIYSEGIYVGYRYYDKRKIKPLFEFGYGLSYTDFTYSDLKLNKDVLGADDTLELTFKVSNTGDFDGEEIAQVYISFPENSLLKHELIALKGFTKKPVKKGESEIFTVSVPMKELKVYHPVNECFMLESGTYKVYVGKSSRLLELSADFTLNAPKVKTKLSVDNSLCELAKHEEILDRVVNCVASQNDLDPKVIRQKLLDLAPSMFCGMLVAFTEFLGVDISRQELSNLLQSD